MTDLNNSIIEIQNLILSLHNDVITNREKLSQMFGYLLNIGEKLIDITNRLDAILYENTVRQ